MRLIDADELNKFPIRLDHCDKEHGSEVFVLGIESVLEYAEYLPTVDAVPVTRCKDCRHGEPDLYIIGDEDDEDGVWCNYYDFPRPSAGFCEKGKKEEERP